MIVSKRFEKEDHLIQHVKGLMEKRDVDLEILEDLLKLKETLGKRSTCLDS